ncbi:MotA/TolQ/ExbB proton channel family protein [Enterovibrio sp. ZSDZ35]|uniref:MotA/TolQ/ExbB proton channel family protein n=1 Tax=Enterovibrio qingdaonensis TaxID=2899818 RepID=A0ABT5QJ64_9GAMM|nr:MotA/TolQ/ExbB proton channel family protein [Enterovibrio sp. ZSDZ35]MDD1781026.1 MotA/TolQ/ExbB proton channel family protein [Enterovibrio sp. ZSDZ35]
MIDITYLDANQPLIWLPSLDAFMTQGGPVLWVLLVVAALSWILVIERVLYLFFTYPKAKKVWVSRWEARKDHASWASKALRDGWLFEAHLQLFSNLNFIKGLVAICPMLGLMGTVTGMISVFDVMATAGSNEPRAMAAGISMATLPTLAGMVIALTGLFAHARITKTCERCEAALAKAMRIRG